jgi:hypothetical protein
MRMRPIPSFRLLRTSNSRKLVLLDRGRRIMNFTPRFRFLDDVLFLLALFVPVSVLMAGSLALAALGAM